MAGIFVCVDQILFKNLQYQPKPCQPVPTVLPSFGTYGSGDDKSCTDRTTGIKLVA